ncbi:hypothetical protein PENTCL1PPCAC_4854, partial [Pristionchus entomophagus]
VISMTARQALSAPAITLSRDRDTLVADDLRRAALWKVSTLKKMPRMQMPMSRAFSNRAASDVVDDDNAAASAPTSLRFVVAD